MNKNKLFITVSSLGLLLALVLMFFVNINMVDAGQEPQYTGVVLSVEGNYLLIKVDIDTEQDEIKLQPNDLVSIDHIGLPEPTGIETPTDRP